MSEKKIDPRVGEEREAAPPAPEEKHEISWRSAMDPPAQNDEPAADASAAAPDAPSGEAVSEEGSAPAQGGAVSAFGAREKDADDLWASLAADIPPATDPGAEQARKEPAVSADSSRTSFDVSPEAPADAKSAKKQKAIKPRVAAAGPFNGKSLGPVLPSRALMRDEEGFLVPTPPTVTSRLFAGLALSPIILPLVLLAAQVLFTLDVRALWYSDEVRYAEAYRNMIAGGNWLVLELNGNVYPDKPPMFFWFLKGIDDLAAMFSHMLPFAVTQAMVFFAGVAVSGLLCLLATHALASLVGRVDRRTVLAADLILISGFFFAGLLHYLRMDLLFAALITFSHVLLFHAVIRDKAPLLMILGFVFAGAAVLVKGPLGFALPLLAALCFLIWQGRILRVFRLDFLFGLIFGLALPAAWLALAWMNAGDSFLHNILGKQVLARALNTWHHAEPWYHYLMTFPLIWLPWTLLLLFLPWGRFMGKTMREGIKASRAMDGAGIAYLWCAFLPGFILLSLVSIKIPIYCLPLFPPLAVLSARAILRMRPMASACLQYALAVFLALLGMALLFSPMVPESMLPIPRLPEGVMILGGICLVFACVLAFLVHSRRGEGMVLVMALFTTAFAFPLWTIAAPSLDVFLSPKAQAGIIKTYREAGYAPITFKVYPGTYTYYAGNTHDAETWEKAMTEAEKHPKAILALRANDWDKLDKKPEGFAEVNRQIIAERAYVLVARPPMTPAEPPEPAEFKPEPAPAPRPETTEPLAPPQPEAVEPPAQPESEAVEPPAQPEQPGESAPAPPVVSPAPVPFGVESAQQGRMP